MMDEQQEDQRAIRYLIPSNLNCSVQILLKTTLKNTLLSRDKLDIKNI